jgi:hypothetical protein
MNRSQVERGFAFATLQGSVFYSQAFVHIDAEGMRATAAQVLFITRKPLQVN